VEYTEKINIETDLKIKQLIKWLGITSSKYYSWRNKQVIPGDNPVNRFKIPKSHWLLYSEINAIIDYAKEHPEEGYRRLAYMMLDENVVAASPSSVYRVLKKAGLLNKWNTVKSKTKGKGFNQPTKFNEHWHTDIKYVNFRGTFLFLISVIDGFSRYIVHHELRTHMQESDVVIVIENALEKYPDAKPNLITDNGSQYISKDFAKYLKMVELKHIRTSVRYPQSNGKIERFHRTIQTECISRQSLIDLDDARNQLTIYINYYNTKRLHSSLYYLTPEDYVMGRVETRLKEREEKLLNAKKNRFLYRNAI